MASYAYVANNGSNTVSVIDVATNAVTVIDVGSGPFGVAFTPDGSTAYVTNDGSGTVSVIDVATNAVTATIDVGSVPSGVAFTPDGSTAYVVNNGSGTVSVIDVATNAVTVIDVGSGPFGVAFTPDGSTAYVTNYGSNTVSVIDVATNVVTATIDVGTNPAGVAFTPDGSTAYVTNNGSGTVSVIDVATNAVTATIDVGSVPFGVAITPNGSTAYVTNDNSGTVSVIDVATNAVTVIGVGSGPFGVAFTPDGSTAYVVNNGSGTVSVIDVATNVVTATIGVGSNPYGVAITPAVSSSMSGAIASASTVSGTLKVGTPLEGEVASVSALTGTVGIGSHLVGHVASASALTANLLVAMPFAGNVTSTSALSGSLTLTEGLRGSTSSVSTLTANLLVAMPFAGAVSSVSALTGALKVGTPLEGEVASASSASATIGNRLPLAGKATSTSSATATLGIGSHLVGHVASVSTLAGTLGIGSHLVGHVASVSALTGTVGIGSHLVGHVASVSTLAGSVAVPEVFTGHIGSTSTLTGDLPNNAMRLVGHVASASALTANLLVESPFAGNVTSTSALSGSLTFIAHAVNPNEAGYAYLKRPRSARAIAVVTVAVTPPPAPGPPPGPGNPPSTTGIQLSPIWRVSEVYNPPTLIAGLPYGDSSREPWQPSSVIREIWAMQLQVLIGGQDATYFRNLPTEVQTWSSQEPFGDASATVMIPGVTSFDPLPEPAALPTGFVVGIASTYTGNGYWLVAEQGLVSAYGDAGFYGDPLGILNLPASGIASHPTEYGYAVCARDGGVFTFGAMQFYGSLPGQGITPSAPIIGITMTATGNGYWLLGQDGSIYSFGDAVYYGNADVGWPTNAATGITRSSGGAGYVIVADNGGVFTFGDATFYGSGVDLSAAPFVGIAASSEQEGYLLVNSLGEAYAFGSQPYEGGITWPLNQPVDSVSLTPSGAGYWMCAQDGGVFTFGDATFYGSDPGGGVVAEGSLSWLALGAPVTINRVMPPPGPPSVTPVGTPGTTTYEYVITALTGVGETQGSAPGETTTGNATLSSTNYNALSWTGTPNGDSYNVYKLVSGTYRLLGNTTGTSFDDTGQGTTAQSPPTSPSAVTTLFEGVIADWDDNLSTGGEIGLQLQIVGVLFQLDWYLAKPTINLPFIGYSPTSGQPLFGWDVGTAIAQAINSTMNDPSAGTALGQGPLPTLTPAGSAFSGHLCTPVETGIVTVAIGTWNQICSGYLSSLLASAQTAGGAQWTVLLQRPRTPVIVQKNLTSNNWTVSTGAHGESHQLALDLTGAANVIYGQGTTPPSLYVIGSEGNQPMVGQWQNEQYPRIPPPAPAFPLGVGQAFTPGGGVDGFSPFSSWMRISGYPLVSTDAYLANDLASVTLDSLLIEAWQQQAGLPVTGNVDKATWDAAFSSGENEGGVSNVWYSPLWQLAEVEPYTYTPSGAPNGLNPAFNPRVPRIERFEQMGQQLMKSQGILSAISEGAQLQIPSWTGTITLTADPVEGSRFDIQAGQNITLQYFHGRSVMFHISAVSVTWSSLSVQLTVSSQALDLATLAAIWARDNQALGPSRQARPSLANLNMSTAGSVFDAESGAGVVPPTNLPAGTWVVVKVPMEESGSVALTSFTTDPMTPFAVGVFSGPVTGANIEAAMGSFGPLQADPLGNNPWNDYAYVGANGGPGLYAYGLLYGAGGLDGACGYYPSDPTAIIQTLTGKYVDGQTWPFASAPGYAPWLWVAFWAQDATTVSGQMLPAPPT